MACLLNCNPDQINFYGLHDAGLKSHFKKLFLKNHILFRRREAQPLWASWQMEISKFAYSESRVTNFFYLCGSLWVEDISKETLLLLFSPGSILSVKVACFDEQFGRKKTDESVSGKIHPKTNLYISCKINYYRR